MGAPQRRTIYTASLETHIDQLHRQLEEYNLIQVQPEQLEPYRGLNSKTAKVRFSLPSIWLVFYANSLPQSMVAGLQKDMSDMKLKALELERSVSSEK